VIQLQHLDRCANIAWEGFHSALRMGKFYNAWRAAWAAKDLDAIAELVHEDWFIFFHSNGKKVHKPEWKKMVESLLKNDTYKQERQRCIFENHDIVVMHMFVTFPNGNVDAVMYVAHLKDGQMHRSETGSTPVSVVQKDAGHLFEEQSNRSDGLGWPRITALTAIVTVACMVAVRAGSR